MNYILKDHDRSLRSAHTTVIDDEEEEEEKLTLPTDWLRRGRAGCHVHGFLRLTLCRVLDDRVSPANFAVPSCRVHKRQINSADMCMLYNCLE